MPNRRNVLIGLGGSIAIAGCSGQTEDEEPEEPEPEPEEELEPQNESEPEPEPEEEPESTNDSETNQQEEIESEEEGEAVFEFVSISPKNEELSTEEEIRIEAEVKNTGTATGDGTIEFRIEDELIEERQLELESGEVTTVGTNIDSQNIKPGTVVFSFHSKDDSINSEFILEEVLKKWQKEMQNAEELFKDALDKYATQANGPTNSIVDIMFSVEFDWVEPHKNLADAQEEISSARGRLKRGTDERKIVQRARDEIILVDEFTLYQSKHNELYERFVSTFETLLDEEAEWPEPQLTDKYASIEEDFEEKKSEFGELEPKFSDPELYDKKMEQMTSELDTANMVITGINYILDPGFGTLQERAALAKREFSDVLDTIENKNSYPSVEAIDQDYVEIVTDWHELAEDIERDLRTI